MYKKPILFLLKILLGFLPIAAVQASLKISMGRSAYLTKAVLKSQLNHYTDIGLDLEKYSHFQNWFFGGKALSSFFIDSSRQNYISVPDLFLGHELSFSGYNFNIVLGRRLQSKQFLYDIKRESDTHIKAGPEPWSFMDEIWSLGLWQGQIQWDHLLLEEQGLTGAFFTLQKNQIAFTVFLSGLFFPNSTPSIEITPKGEIFSTSRWFSFPQSSFTAFNQKIEGLYWMEKPYLKNVLLNDSVAFRFRAGSTKKQWFNISYAYKPINQIYFKIKPQLSIENTTLDSFIHYHAFKHSLVSIDIGLKNKFLTSILSVTQEIPRNPKVPENWIAPVLPQALFAGAHFKIHLKKYLLDYIEFNSLYSRFVYKEKHTELTNQLKLNLATGRFRLHKGFYFGAVTKPLAWKNQKIFVKAGWQYSVPEQGGWLNAEIHWKMSPKLFVSAGIDILGAENNNIDTFFNTYRYNDRIRLKAAYEMD